MKMGGRIWDREWTQIDANGRRLDRITETTQRHQAGGIKPLMDTDAH